jgi:hypothetical protein
MGTQNIFEPLSESHLIDGPPTYPAMGWLGPIVAHAVGSPASQRSHQQPPAQPHTHESVASSHCVSTRIM